MWNKYCAKPSWDEEEMDGRNWSSSVTLHKVIQNSSILEQKNHQCLGLFSALSSFAHLVWADPFHVFFSFVTWAKWKLWKWKMLDAAQACKTLPAGSRNPNETS